MRRALTESQPSISAKRRSAVRVPGSTSSSCPTTSCTSSTEGAVSEGIVDLLFPGDADPGRQLGEVSQGVSVLRRPLPICVSLRCLDPLETEGGIETGELRVLRRRNEGGAHLAGPGRLRGAQDQPDDRVLDIAGEDPAAHHEVLDTPGAAAAAAVAGHCPRGDQPVVTEAVL